MCGFVGAWELTNIGHGMHLRRPAVLVPGSRSSLHAPTCSWGSIISDQREALVMMAPFSTDSGSMGKPSVAHLARRVSSVQVWGQVSRQAFAPAFKAMQCGAVLQGQLCAAVPASRVWRLAHVCTHTRQQVERLDAI